MFDHPLCKEVFLMCKWNIFYFSLCLLSLYNTESDSAFTLFHQIVIHSDKTLPKRPFLRLNSHSSLSLSSHVRCWCSSPLFNFAAVHWTSSSLSMSLSYWGAQDWTQTWSHQCCAERKDPIPRLASKALPNAVQDAVSTSGRLTKQIIDFYAANRNVTS